MQKSDLKKTNKLIQLWLSGWYNWSEVILSIKAGKNCEECFFVAACFDLLFVSVYNWIR